MSRTPAPRRTWQALSPAEKQQRLATLRRRQQRQIEHEARMLVRHLG
ncbi:hypothetical protein [Nocardioides ferulae]|nr:hypothetical protein [Nocardioides ferulae]